MQKRQLLLRSEVQGAKQPVLEVMEGYGLVIQGTGPSLGPAGCKPLPAPGGHRYMAAQLSQLQEVGASQVAAPPRFFPSEMEVPSVGQWVGSLCALHSPP